MIDTQTRAYVDMATAINTIANNTPSQNSSDLDLQTQGSRAAGISGFIEPLTRLLNHMITTPPIESYYF